MLMRSCNSCYSCFSPTMDAASWITGRGQDIEPKEIFVEVSRVSWQCWGHCWAWLCLTCSLVLPTGHPSCPRKAVSSRHSGMLQFPHCHYISLEVWPSTLWKASGRLCAQIQVIWPHLGAHSSYTTRDIQHLLGVLAFQPRIWLIGL